MENRKSTLWKILEKYDGNSEFDKFCNSISRFIQDKSNGDDVLVIYQHSTKIDREDYNKIDNSIGHVINNFLFAI
jgi:hypothetical protein